MAGRFPLYTDADIHGPYVKGLVLNGWDVLRAVRVYPEKTPDLQHFERAARERRVLVSNDAAAPLTVPLPTSRRTPRSAAAAPASPAPACA